MFGALLAQLPSPDPGLLNYAYERWALKVDGELAEQQGHELRRARLHEGCRLVVRKVFRQRAPPVADDNGRSFCWLEGRLHELLRCRQQDSDGNHDEVMRRARRLTNLLGNPPQWFSKNLEVQGWHRWAQKFAKDMLKDDKAEPSEADRHIEEEECSQLEGLASDAREAHKKERRRGWHQWTLLALDRGAGKGHKFTHEAVKWEATTTILENGVVTADPLQLLLKDRASWKTIWNASDVANKFAPELQSELLEGTCDHLPLAEPGEIRKAAAQFANGTAQTYDGFHPKHYELMSDGALRCVALWWAISEATGQTPAPLQATVTVLMAKPSGGTRPIGLLPSAHRVWQAVRRPWCQKWENDHEEYFWAMGANRSAMDLVWRQAVLSESAAMVGQHAASLLWDGVKYYEMFDWRRLVDEAVALDFPMAILRPTLRAYMNRRVLLHQGLAVQALWPRRGIVAGDGAATTMVRVYGQRSFKKVALNNPGVTFGIYLDDFQLAARGRERQVGHVLAKAGGDLRREVEGPMKSQLSHEKAASTSTSPITLEILRRCLGKLAGAGSGGIRNLGADFTGGQRLSKRYLRVRRERFRKLVVRGRRLRTLTKEVGGKASRLFVSGLLPSATYGDEVQGYTDAELKVLKTQAGAAQPPFSTGRSLEISLLLSDGGVARHAAPCLLRWAREVWDATTWPRAGTVVAKTLAFMWAKVVGEKVTWKNRRGPLGTAFLEVARLGWTFQSAWVVVTEVGRDIDFRELGQHKTWRNSLHNASATSSPTWRRPS